MADRFGNEIEVNGEPERIEETSVGPRTCLIDLRKFKTVNALEDHLVREHSPLILQQYKCKICHEKFDTQEDLEKDEARHKGTHRFQCTKGNERFATKHLSKLHKKNYRWKCKKNRRK